MGDDKKTPDFPWRGFWPKLIISVSSVAVGASIAGLFSLLVTAKIQKKTQERSNDIALSKLIVDILDKENPNLHKSLSVLVATMSDSNFRYAMKLAIDSNPSVSPEIKKEVNLSALKPSLVISQDEDTTKIIKPDDTTCAIIYLEGDSVSESEAKALQHFLLHERKSRFQKYTFRYYPLVPQNIEWFRRSNLLTAEKGGTNPIARVYFNDSNYHILAYRLYLAALEGLNGVVYKEKYIPLGQYYPPDNTNKGNGVLKNFLFTDYSFDRLDKSDKKLCGYDFVILIPPYYLNIYTLDSIMEGLHPPQE